MFNLERTYDAPVERVSKAFSEAAKSKWFGESRDAVPECAADRDGFAVTVTTSTYFMLQGWAALRITDALRRG
jgi:uncharacterized protein YndB with AHSA1/START domain